MQNIMSHMIERTIIRMTAAKGGTVTSGRSFTTRISKPTELRILV